MRKSTSAADPNRRRSSRRRYWGFVADYKERRLADSQDDGEDDRPREAEASPRSRGKRREYLRDYMRWLWPHRYAVGVSTVVVNGQVVVDGGDHTGALPGRVITRSA